MTEPRLPVGEAGLLVSFVTSTFGTWQARWHNMAEKTPALGAVEGANSEELGLLARIDAAGQLVWQVPTLSPAGFAQMGDHIYVASMLANKVMVLDDTGEVDDVFSHPLMGDLHSITPDGPDHFLLTSSASDSILRLSLDGQLTWAWRAVDHGFTREGLPLHPAGFDYRRAPIETGHQHTHLNSAVGAKLIDGRDVILTTLFHQGALVAIDRHSGKAEVLLRGLDRPHSIRPFADGWVLCSSGDSTVVLLDASFTITTTIRAGFDWVQDALPLSPDELLIADANNHRLVRWSLPERRARDEITYAREWKVYQLEMALDADTAHAGLASAEAAR